MRLTVLQQQTKALQEERPKTGADVSKRLENVKHLLWHGNTEEALERLDQFRLHPFGHPLQISVDASYVDVPSSRQHFSQKPQHDLMLPFARLDLPTFRAGDLLSHIPCGLVRDHRSLNLLK